jgi:hypothetical protein
LINHPIDHDRSIGSIDHPIESIDPIDVS